MKQVLLFTLCIMAFTVCGYSQHSNMPGDTIKVVLENDKLKVTEYSSTPGRDVCGKGKHSHAPHLTILLTDAIVRVTTDGKVQDVDVKAGTTFWSDTETHIAVNNGKKPVKAYLVEVK